MLYVYQQMTDPVILLCILHEHVTSAFPVYALVHVLMPNNGLKVLCNTTELLLPLHLKEVCPYGGNECLHIEDIDIGRYLHLATYKYLVINKYLDIKNRN